MLSGVVMEGALDQELGYDLELTLGGGEQGMETGCAPPPPEDQSL